MSGRFARFRSKGEAWVREDIDTLLCIQWQNSTTCWGSTEELEALLTPRLNISFQTFVVLLFWNWQPDSHTNGPPVQLFPSRLFRWAIARKCTIGKRNKPTCILQTISYPAFFHLQNQSTECQREIHANQMKYFTLGVIDKREPSWSAEYKTGSRCP